jgi:hypothetical protein
VRVLWVATKPPLPAVDGGRLVTVETLRALAGVDVGGVVVAPAPVAGTSDLGPWRIVCVPSAPRWRQVAGIVRARSIVIARHLQPAVERAVARILDTERIDVVHAEQLHALPQCAPARARGFPVVLRAQNVEQDVLSARFRRATARVVDAVERRRLVAYETAAVVTASATIGLTARDVARLVAVAGPAARIHHITAPFREVLPAGPPLSGTPAVVVFGDAGWFPNVDGAAWFARDVWPVVREIVPPLYSSPSMRTRHAWSDRTRRRCGTASRCAERAAMKSPCSRPSSFATRRSSASSSGEISSFVAATAKQHSRRPSFSSRVAAAANARVTR